jgi:hypothetical protein
VLLVDFFEVSHQLAESFGIGFLSLRMEDGQHVANGQLAAGLA